jgi:hypothetical protein
MEMAERVDVSFALTKTGMGKRAEYAGRRRSIEKQELTPVQRH